jgi:hypothetical protein
MAQLKMLFYESVVGSAVKKEFELYCFCENLGIERAAQAEKAAFCNALRIKPFELRRFPEWGPFSQPRAFVSEA